MSTTIPVLNIYYIKKSSNYSKSKKAFKKIKKTILNTFKPTSVFTSIGISTEAYKSLKRFMDNNRFNIITLEDANNNYENVYKNDWVENDKAFKKKQYYIRHPKRGCQHKLIEAQAFSEYALKEVERELLNYILSRCSLKRIVIEREELIEASAKSNQNIQNHNLSEEVDFGKAKEIIHRATYSEPSPKKAGLEEYLWLDEHQMTWIDTLSQGGIFENIYDSDMTFNVTASEAEILGLNLKYHKKYKYRIEIETVKCP